jgi:hypothetical protein
MRTLRVLLLACLMGALFSALVLYVRRQRARKISTAVAIVQQESARHPAQAQLPLSPLEALMQGVNDYLWIEEGPSQASKTRLVKVDPFVQRLVISATGHPHGFTLNLFDPKGKEVKPTAAKQMQLLQLDDGVAASIEKPETGVWRLVAVGDGQLSLWVRAASSLGIDSIDVVDAKTGRSVDVQADEAVIQETPLRATVRLSAETGISPRFSLVTNGGAPLQNPVAIDGSDSGPSGSPRRRQFIFRILWTAPHSDFRLLIEGADTRGKNFQRIGPTLFRVKFR